MLRACVRVLITMLVCYVTTGGALCVVVSRQVVYHEATRIGCGQASCPQSIYKVFRACNYAIGSVLQYCTHRHHLSVSLSVSVSLCLSVCLCLSVSQARARCLHLQDGVSCDHCLVLFDL